MNASALPRPEYPRPSWVRNAWLNLNGSWLFAIDHEDRESCAAIRFSQQITVPFCPESTLSGIGHTDFMNVVWYRREVRVPAAWRGQRLLLHFQAVDYDATVWIDGAEQARHRGGFTPFTVDLGCDWPECFELTMRARTLRDRNRPRGKQSDRRENYLCCYTRTSGIWQTVWLEPVPEIHLRRPRITPEPDGFSIALPLSANRPDCRIRVAIGHEGRTFAEHTVGADAGLMPIAHLTLAEKDRHCWSPETPFLYDLEFTLHDAEGRVIDHVRSYAGWRFITVDGMNLRLNGEAVFQKLVLDQGFYPDGIMTAPDDAALVRDIELAQAAGFNGARLHQKVFEERFLYHADRMGYLVWGEFGDWGFDWATENQPPAGSYQPGAGLIGQWLEVLARDYNHPAIIGWCGLNETKERIVAGTPTVDVVTDVTKAVFLAARLADPTRPVLDASGYIHRLAESDLYDCHDYGTPEEVAENLKKLTPGGDYVCNCDPVLNTPWRGQPFFLSEIGGMKFPPDHQEANAWGYGDGPRTQAEFYDRFARLLAVIRHDARIFGYCYTQLTDVFQEVNGLYNFDRTPKFDAVKLHRLQQQPSAYEQQSPTIVKENEA